MQLVSNNINVNIYQSQCSQQLSSVHVNNKLIKLNLFNICSTSTQNILYEIMSK